jgi:two-component system KDP operon response regulator KdpE
MSAKILLVEDESDTRLALTVRLEASGYTVLHAVDGASAIGVASLESPDLIVLDLGLPDHDGYTVMERLKSNFATSSIPVIVLTARDPERNQERAYEVGALEFYQKPVPWKWFLASIERALARPRSETMPGN